MSGEHKPPRDPGKLEGVQKRIQDFDAVALRILLRSLGYRGKDIVYCGNVAQTSRPQLFHSMDILAHPMDILAAPPDPDSIADTYRVASDTLHAAGDGAVCRIEANLGLLSNRTPLPAYFQDLLADRAYQGPLIALLDLLDDRLIDDRLASFRPEWEPSILPDWDGVRFDLLSLTSLPTSSSLHSVFQRVFPELGVAVRYAPASRPVEMPEVVLGTSAVGEASFGGEAAVPVAGFAVALVCREPVSREDVPWIQEIDRRLRERVFPLLGGTNVHLTVTALLFEAEKDAQFDRQSRLGQNPLPGGIEGLRRVIVFAGAVPEGGAWPHGHMAPPPRELIEGDD